MTWKVKAESRDHYHVIDDKTEVYIAVCLNEQQARLIANAPKMLWALEAIAVLSLSDETGEIARTAIAAVKGERADEKA